jgi:hypothetical protein
VGHAISPNNACVLFSRFLCSPIGMLSIIAVTIARAAIPSAGELRSEYSIFMGQCPSAMLAPWCPF